MSRMWHDEKELAALLLARARARRKIVLSPDTGEFVGAKLMTVSAKPTRDEIAKLLCDNRCSEPCFTCRGKANGIVAAYGQRSR